MNDGETTLTATACKACGGKGYLLSVGHVLKTDCIACKGTGWRTPGVLERIWRWIVQLIRNSRRRSPTPIPEKPSEEEPTPPVEPEPEPPVLAQGLRWSKVDVGQPVRYKIVHDESFFLDEQTVRNIISNVTSDIKGFSGTLWFVEVSGSAETDIEVNFGKIDGPGGTLGFAIQPASGTEMSACGAPCGNVKFESEEGINATDFYNIALHEFLHAIGIDHTPANIGSIMDSSYWPGTPKASIDPYAIGEIRKRYP